MTMIQRRFYFPEDLYRDLEIFAKSTRKTITQTLRELVREGLHQKRKTRKNGMQALLDLAKMAEKEHWTGPNDLSINHDKYFVEAYEELKEGKKPKYK